MNERLQASAERRRANLSLLLSVGLCWWYTACRTILGLTSSTVVIVASRQLIGCIGPTYATDFTIDRVFINVYSPKAVCCDV